MKYLLRLGLRGRLIVLMLLANIPMAAFMLVHTFDDQNRKLEEIHQNAIQIGQLTANQLGANIEGFQQFLVALANDRCITEMNEAASNAYFNDLASQALFFSNIGLVRPDGNVVASILLRPEMTTNYAAQPWFTRLQRERGFVVGDFQVDRLTSTAGISFAYPLPNQPAGSPVAAVFLELNLDFLHQITAHAKLPADGVITIVDANGTILSRFPDPWQWVGKSQPQLKKFGQQTNHAAPFVENPGVDRVARFYQFVPVPHSKGQLGIVVGFSHSQIIAESNRLLMINMSTNIALTCLILTAMWIMGTRMLINPLKKVILAAQQLGSGDMTARAEADSDASPEFSRLAQTFNAMANSLQHGQAEIHALNMDLDRKVQERTEQMAETFELNQKIVELSTMGIAVYKVSGECVFVTPKMAGIVGTTVGQLIGENYKSIKVWEQSGLLKLAETTLGNKQANNVLLHMNTGFRKDCWLDCHMNILTRKGEQHLLLMIDDVTEQKQLSQNRDFFFSEALDLVCIASLDGYFTQLSPSWSQTLGWSAAELMSRPYLEFVHPDDRAATIAEAEKLARGEKVIAFDNRYRCRDESYRWLSWRTSAHLEQGMAYAVVRDVTEQKRLERELLEVNNQLKITAAALAHERDNFQRYLDLVNVLIVAVDSSGCITMLNRKTTEVLGYPASEMIGENLFLKLLPEQVNGSSVYHLFKESRAGKWPLPDYYESEMLTRSGEKRLIAWNLAHFRDVNGAIDGSIGAGEDVTERKKAEEELKKSKEAAEVANRAKSEFLANMSHEIRTPMNSILGFTEILDDEIHDPTHKGYLASIKSSGRILMTLINDILDLSKIEAGRMEINCTAVNIASLAKDIEAIFKPRFEERFLAFELRVSPNLPDALLLDEIRLRQILFNLVGNAVKFTDHGKITLNIDVQQNSDPINIATCDLTISVCDTGVGIPEDQLELIFEVFQQKQNQSYAQYGGSGLGLSISRRLAELMGGRIEVSSRSGTGSEFRVILPGVKRTAAANVSENISPWSRDFTFNNRHLLIADDIPANRILLRKMLEVPGLTVSEAANGAEVLAAVANHQPDLILLDIKMPVLDGYETVKRLKADAQWQSIPVVAVTASAAGEGEKLALAAGFNDYLRKPVVRSELFRLLADFLGHSSPVTAVSSAVSKHPDAKQKCKASPDLLKTLREEILPECGALQARLYVTHIRALVKRVTTLASDYEDPVLATWVRQLNKYVESFNIMEIKNSLASLKDLLPDPASKKNRGGQS